MKKRRAARNWANKGNRGPPEKGSEIELPAMRVQRAAPKPPPPPIEMRQSEMGLQHLLEKKWHRQGLGKVMRGNEGFNLKLNPSHPPLLYSSPSSSVEYENIPHSLFMQSSNTPKLNIDPIYSHIVGKRPPVSRKLEFEPQIDCKNRFQVLENLSAACSMSESSYKDKDWIFDCGATDTMSFDESDFTGMSQPHKKYVQTANGELLTVKGTRTFNISPALKISNCKYVPTLSHKLLAVSHVTKELNCTLLMLSRPHFLRIENTVDRD